MANYISRGFLDPAAPADWRRSDHPPVIQCDCCEQPLELDDGMTNQCDCGALYNGSAQRLTDPSHWGEETGERFDCNGNYIDGGDYDDEY